MYIYTYKLQHFRIWMQAISQTKMAFDVLWLQWHPQSYLLYYILKLLMIRRIFRILGRHPAEFRRQLHPAAEIFQWMFISGGQRHMIGVLIDFNINSKKFRNPPVYELRHILHKLWEYLVAAPLLTAWYLETRVEIPAYPNFLRTSSGPNRVLIQ